MSKFLLWWAVELEQVGGLHGDIRWFYIDIGSIDYFVNILFYHLYYFFCIAIVEFAYITSHIIILYLKSVVLVHSD